METEQPEETFPNTETNGEFGERAFLLILLLMTVCVVGHCCELILGLYL